MLDDASNQCYKIESGKFIIASAKDFLRFPQLFRVEMNLETASPLNLPIYAHASYYRIRASDALANHFRNASTPFPCSLILGLGLPFGKLAVVNDDI